MPVITRAIYVPIPGVPEKPTALRHHAPATELTEPSAASSSPAHVAPERTPRT